MKKEPVTTRDLLPHGQSMHLIDDVLWFDPELIEGEVSAVLRENGPYFGEYGFEDHWLIEISAQASAAVYLLSRYEAGGRGPKGYLVSVRDFKIFHSNQLKALDQVNVHVVFEVEATPLGQSRCQVSCGEMVIAEGEMTFLLETED